VISKPDVTILDSKAEALYQIGLLKKKKRNNLALNYYKALVLNAKTTI
jgi:hypothetical protein